MSLKGKNNEEKIWNYLKGKGLNDYAVSGLMGNLYAESALNPMNLQQSYEKKLGMTDEDYTHDVDSGDYDNFIKDSAGYGLAQWSYWTRKKNLLEFAQNKSRSIGDLEMQLDFLYQELSSSYAGVLKVLKSAKSVREASDVVLLKFEKPKNQSESVQIKRAEYGQKYYDKYNVSKAYAEKAKEKVKEISEARKEKAKEVVKEVVKSKKTTAYEEPSIFHASDAGNYKTVANLRMRKGAGTKKDIIKVIPEGSQVNATGWVAFENGVKWLVVTHQGNTGYCSSEYLKRT